MRNLTLIHFAVKKNESRIEIRLVSIIQYPMKNLNQK